MKYFMVTAKCGHVGKNKYFEGTIYVKAHNGKDAARKVREMPRVKHDRKDAIMAVQEVDFDVFEAGRKANHHIHYYTCGSRQEQNYYLQEIEDNIFCEDNEKRKSSKTHSLRKVYNTDPLYEDYQRHRGTIDKNGVA